jgi:hypothetical protein
MALTLSKKPKNKSERFNNISKSFNLDKRVMLIKKEDLLSSKLVTMFT